MKKQSSLYQKIAGTFDICCSRRFDTNHIQPIRGFVARGPHEKDDPAIQHRKALKTQFSIPAAVILYRDHWQVEDRLQVGQIDLVLPEIHPSPDTPWPANPGEYTAFASEFATARATDLSRPPFLANKAFWTDPVDYTACLNLVDAVRAAALEVLRYESVRDPQSRANLALLTCRVFTQNDFVDRQTWHFHFTSSGVRSIREAPSATIQFDQNVFAADTRIAAMKWDRPL